MSNESIRDEWQERFRPVVRVEPTRVSPASYGAATTVAGPMTATVTVDVALAVQSTSSALPSSATAATS